MDLIRFENVDFSYARAPILTELSLSVTDGAVTVLVGPSGSGKSTVLRLIAGFEAPQRGTVSIGGEVVSRNGRVLVPPEARGVSVVFQDLALWPHLTVRQTLEFVLGRDGPFEERRRRIEETLTAVGLERHVDARPASLSGGERQRVALARAIVTRPRILLMDEPLSSLDPPLRHALMEELRQLQQRFHLTILYVTHNQQETFILGDHAVVINGGRIEQWGTPRDLYERPRNVFVATFLGRCALLRAFVRGDRLESALGVMPLSTSGLPSESDLHVVVRPEDIVLGEEGAFSGTVERTTCLGNVFEMEIAGSDWRLSADVSEPLKPGAVVRFSIRKVAAVPRV